MSDTKISALTAAASALLADEFAINEAGTSKKLTLAQIQTLLSVFTAGSGTATYKPAGIITSLTSSVGNGADTTEDTLWTYSLPANTLAVNGQYLWVTGIVSAAANTDNKSTRLYFGSTTIFTRTSADNNVGIIFQAVIMRLTNTTQLAMGFASLGSAFTTFLQTSPAETLSGAVTMKVTGQDNTAATANAVVLKGLHVGFGS